VLKAGYHDSPSREGSSHPASGRSPDSRFAELAAFPTFVSGVVASPPRLQWRGRAGFTPASLLSLQQHQKQSALTDYACGRGLSRRRIHVPDLTTKDTKNTKAEFAIQPLCNFVSFVVHEIETPVEFIAKTG
jgi:hypothetical protein